jgi:hypothetical protein
MKKAACARNNLDSMSRMREAGGVPARCDGRVGGPRAKSPGHRGTVTGAKGILSLARGMDAREVYFAALRFEMTLNGCFWRQFKNTDTVMLCVMYLKGFSSGC